MPFRLSSYAFDLPERLIAQTPAKARDASRLMVLDRTTGKTETAVFADLDRYLPENCLLVANNSKVVPARIMGAKPTGGKVEILLLTPPPLMEIETGSDGSRRAEAQALLRASKGPRVGERVLCGGEGAVELTVRVLERGDFGRCKVEFAWRGDLLEVLGRLGSMPLPPYIKRKADENDLATYQTLHANDAKAGSVAAPTAGLHFTPGLRQRLREKNIGWAEVTLYVGYGTFSPVREEDIRNHVMHAEYIEVPEETAQEVKRAKEEGRDVVAVGTTSVRSLEGAFRATSGIGEFKGWTDIFISPGYEFKVVDKLITNFHLPLSSLVIMVSAFAGREAVLRAYHEAIASEFRFFSYGDAMLIL